MKSIIIIYLLLTGLLLFISINYVSYLKNQLILKAALDCLSFKNGDKYINENGADVTSDCSDKLIRAHHVLISETRSETLSLIEFIKKYNKAIE